jgi:hypothetical protein
MRTIERQVNVAYIYTPPMTCINLTRTPTKQSYIGRQPREEKKKGRTLFRRENGGVTPVGHGRRAPSVAK